MDKTAKPLFIPLKREFFFAFLGGTKSWEYRLYGPRWNERTCAPGRSALLSLGYGKQMRAKGRVRDFKKMRFYDFPPETRRALRQCYGRLPWKWDVRIAAIGIDVQELVVEVPVQAQPREFNLKMTL